MATAPAPDPRTVVRFTERLWSEEVAAADPQDILDPEETAYEFGNKRRFVEKDRYNGGHGNG